MIPNPVLGLFRSNVATISAPTKVSATANSIIISGSVTWYKGDATYGVAYKKDADSTWSHKASSSESIYVTLSSLTASTKYNIKLYVKYDGEYQYGSAIDVTTEAAS